MSDNPTGGDVSRYCVECERRAETRSEPEPFRPCSGGRYWRFDACGECDDPECAEGDAMDVTTEIDELRDERDFYHSEAEHYRTAIETWHNLSVQKNVNGPDGPTTEWRRAVNALRAIATGEHA